MKPILCQRIIFFIPLLCHSLIIQNCSSARILCVAPLPSFSHHVFFRPIWKDLANRGHDLVLLTTDPMEEEYPNVREIDWHFVYRRKSMLKPPEWTSFNWPKLLNIYEQYLAQVTLDELEHPEVQNLLKNETEHFDLVICEMHLIYMFGFAHRFKCPLVGISSTDVLTYQHAILGNPTHPLIYPEMFLPYSPNNFYSRVQKLALSSFVKLRSWFRPSQLSQVYKKTKKYFRQDLAPFENLLKNISLVLINVHPVYNYRPLGPKFIEIGGGSHIDRSYKGLPQDISSILNQSKNGVVYFSLGTNVEASQYPQNFINVTVNAFRELPFTIIWKFNKKIENLPENIKIFNWVPQQELLRQKNVKAFITQAGLHSMEESILARVPMVAIPFMSDQHTNAETIARKGMGLKLDKNSLNEINIKKAVFEVIQNTKYKQKVTEIANLLEDSSMEGLEKATWWIEYVIRHQGMPDIFDNPNCDIPLYQYILLDVIGFFIIFAVLLIFVFVSIVNAVSYLLGTIIMLRRNKGKVE